MRSWYERHAAFYRLVSVSSETLEAVNLINDQPYRIRIDMRRNPFRRGQVVFGSLVPWRGEWYWSGEQRLVGDASKVDADDLKKKMKRQSSAIVCRYSKDYEALVRERMSAMHEKMLAFHGGKDLVVYPDGLSMAADWQKEVRWQWEQRPQQEVEEVVRKHGLKEGRPDIKIPQDLLEEKDGLGVFLNPDEGKEIMSHFTTLVAGLKKKGEGLTGDEAGCRFAGSSSRPPISPRFVRRVLEEHGDESVKDGVRAEGRPAGLLAGLAAPEPQGTLLPEMLSVAVGGVRGAAHDHQREPKDGHPRFLCGVDGPSPQGRVLHGREPVQPEPGDPDLAQAGGRGRHRLLDPQPPPADAVSRRAGLPRIPLLLPVHDPGISAGDRPQVASCRDRRRGVP